MTTTAPTTLEIGHKVRLVRSPRDGSSAVMLGSALARETGEIVSLEQSNGNRYANVRFPDCGRDTDRLLRLRLEHLSPC